MTRPEDAFFTPDHLQMRALEFFANVVTKKPIETRTTHDLALHIRTAGVLYLFSNDRLKELTDRAKDGLDAVVAAHAAHTAKESRA